MSRGNFCVRKRWRSIFWGLGDVLPGNEKLCRPIPLALEWGKKEPPKRKEEQKQILRSRSRLERDLYQEKYDDAQLRK